jgi:hypothetical protein
MITSGKCLSEYRRFPGNSLRVRADSLCRGDGIDGYLTPTSIGGPCELVAQSDRSHRLASRGRAGRCTRARGDSAGYHHGQINPNPMRTGAASLQDRHSRLRESTRSRRWSPPSRGAAFLRSPAARNLCQEFNTVFEAGRTDLGRIPLLASLPTHRYGAPRSRRASADAENVAMPVPLGGPAFC